MQDSFYLILLACYVTLVANCDVQTSAEESSEISGRVRESVLFIAFGDVDEDA